MIRGRSRPDGKLRIIIDCLKLAETCKACPFSLICLSGKHFDSYICTQCEAIWIDELKVLVDCDAFEPQSNHNLIPGCPACEPFETNPEEVTKVRGYQAEEEKKTEESSRAADEE